MTPGQIEADNRPVSPTPEPVGDEASTRDALKAASLSRPSAKTVRRVAALAVVSTASTLFAACAPTASSTLDTCKVPYPTTPTTNNGKDTFGASTQAHLADAQNSLIDNSAVLCAPDGSSTSTPDNPQQKHLDIPGVTVNKPSSEAINSIEKYATPKDLIAKNINNFLAGKDDKWGIQKPGINYFGPNHQSTPLPLSEASSAYFVEVNAVPLGVYFDGSTQTVIVGVVRHNAKGEIDGRSLLAIAPFQGLDANSMQLTYTNNGQTMKSPATFESIRVGLRQMGETQENPTMLQTSTAVTAPDFAAFIAYLINNQQVLQLGYTPSSPIPARSADYDALALTTTMQSTDSTEFATALQSFLARDAQVNINNALMQQLKLFGQDPLAVQSGNGLILQKDIKTPVNAQTLSDIFPKYYKLSSLMSPNIPLQDDGPIIAGTYK